MRSNVLVKLNLVTVIIYSFFAIASQTQAQTGLRGDLRQSWAKAAGDAGQYRLQTEQAMIAKNSYYERFGSYRGSTGRAKIRVSGRAGGILVGLPPEPLEPGAPIEPLGIPGFNYELLEKNADRESPRVKIKLTTASNESWEIVCHPLIPVLATAVACDDIPLLYTLTATEGDFGPHGGRIIELGSGECRAEMLYDGLTVTIYILDGFSQKALPIEAKELVINFLDKVAPEQFTLPAKPDAADSNGRSSRFELQDAKLSELIFHETSALELAVKIDGTQFLGKIKNDVATRAQMTPHLLNTRFAFRPAVLDLFAFGRAPKSLTAEILLAQFRIELLRSVNQMLTDEVTFDEKQQLAFALAINRLGEDSSMGEESKLRIEEFISSLASSDFIDAVIAAQSSKLVSDLVDQLDPDRLLTDSEDERVVVASVSDAFMAAFRENWSGEQNSVSVDTHWQASPFLLSIVEEKPWSLSIRDLSVPNVRSNPDSSLVEFKYRIAYRDELVFARLNDQQITASFKEYPNSKQLTKKLVRNMLDSELQILEEYNQFIVLHRLVKGVLDLQILNFPSDKWEEMLSQCARYDKSNVDDNPSGLSVSTRAELWHQSAKKQLRWSRKALIQWDELSPTIPESLQLR